MVTCCIHLDWAHETHNHTHWESHSKPSDGDIINKFRYISKFLDIAKYRYKNKNIDKYPDQMDERLKCGICFHFSQFSQNFGFKKFQFYGTLSFLTCSSINHRKPHSKTPWTHLSAVFWNWHSQKFSKIKVFVFFNILKIFFPTYA